MKITVQMDSSLVKGAFGFHVEVYVREAASAAEALAATQRTTHMLCDGRRTFFRAMPECQSDKNFDTKTTSHRGYARFTVLDQAGDWETPSKTKMPFIGTATAAS